MPGFLHPCFRRYKVIGHESPVCATNPIILFYLLFCSMASNSREKESQCTWKLCNAYESYERYLLFWHRCHWINTLKYLDWEKHPFTLHVQNTSLRRQQSKQIGPISTFLTKGLRQNADTGITIYNIRGMGFQMWTNARGQSKCWEMGVSHKLLQMENQL